MGFFDFFNKKQQSSGSVAKERLGLVLYQDRINISSQMLDMMKNDILKVIANYMEFDESEVEIEITKPKPGEGSAPVLYANIPIKNPRKSSR